MKNKLIVHTSLIQLKKIKQNKKTKLHQKKYILYKIYQDQNKIVNKYINNYIKKGANHIYNNEFKCIGSECNRSDVVYFMWMLGLCFFVSLTK